MLIIYISIFLQFRSVFKTKGDKFIQNYTNNSSFVDYLYELIVNKLGTSINTELTTNEVINKLEYYCSYQDRCHKEVEQKLRSFTLIPELKEKIIVHLIENKYIDEERFAKSFTRGKHNYKGWGKNRIIQELKFREISIRNIDLALLELPNETYLNNFHALAEKNWEAIKERKGQKKNKKFVDFLLRKGYETHLIYDKLKQLDL